MTKTAKQIQTDFMAMVQDSALASAVSGSVYRQGYRPRDSRLEDITVGFVAGVPNQIQTGVVAVCVYVPNIDPYGNGVLVEDGARTAELESIAQQWFDSRPDRGTDYKIDLQDTITTVPVDDIEQHFVSIMLKYELFNE